MARLTYALLAALLLAACGGDSPETRAARGSDASAGEDGDVDACTLLTSEEIQSAAGWAPDTSGAKSYGTTQTCAYSGPDMMKQSIVLVVARPAPKVSSSAELATVEVVVGGRLLGVTTSDFESAKKRAANAATRLR